jgi:lipoprotein-anchoring transpeptidase ErfK/SrfK
MRYATYVLLATLVLTAGCSRETTETAEVVKETRPGTSTQRGFAVPVGPSADPAERERQRFDEGWRSLLGFRDARVTASKGGQSTPVKDIRFVPNGTESFENMNPAAINNAPVVVPLKGDVSGPSVLRTQVYLDRLNFSVGVLDGRWGRNTAIALWWFQRSRGIGANEMGALDEQTYRALVEESGNVPALVQHTVTAENVEGPFVNVPEDMYEKAELDCLCYESKQEKIAERFHTTTDFLAKLNPNVDFSAVKAGDTLLVPNVRPPFTEDRKDIARIVISIQGNTFNAFDAAGTLIFHGPTTLGSKYDPSPSETVSIEKVTFDPWFHYQPTLFHEVPDNEPEANLPPGPNSPVGVVWMALSKPHYGIHGTSDPDSIGYASSHGCVRLTNWDAREVGHRVSSGVQVEFQDTRG